MPSRFAGLAYCALVVVWMTGCATPAPPLKAPPPDVVLSPVYDLLVGETVRDKVSVVIDHAGHGHVLIASTRREEVHHVVIGPEGVLERELVRSSVSPATIASAFDEQGDLHVLLDCTHWVKQGGQWRAGDSPPWELAGFKPFGCWFVSGAPRLTWAFLVRGNDVGAPGRWDWYIFGGAPAAVVWPWHTQASKLVLVIPAADGPGHWIVFDPADELDAAHARTLADGRGNFLVVYDAMSGGFGGINYPRFARLPLASVSEEAGERNIPAGARQKVLLRLVNGQSLTAQFASQGPGRDAGIALDPVSGTALVVRPHDGSRVLRGETWSEEISLPLAVFWDPHLAPAGGDRFHAMIVAEARDPWWGKGSPILYLSFADGHWSAPVELGLADVSSFWGLIWDYLEIGSAGNQQALVIWPMADRIVGRWVSLGR
jgi:hypothetical protein